MPIYKIPMSLCQFTWHHALISFLLFINFTATTCYTLVSSSKTPSVPYSSTKCASIIPEATPTTSYAGFSFPYLLPSTSYYTGGTRIFGKNSTQKYGSDIRFRPSRNMFATNIKGVYKIEAYLTFWVYNMHNLSRNSSYGTSYHRRHRSDQLKFRLDGFWSESLGKGCMVGSASWYSSKGDPLNLDAMLKVNYIKNSTITTSLVSGKLESLKARNDENYFEPILILSFPQLSEYDDKLVREEIDHALPAGVDIPQNSLSLQGREICSVFSRHSIIRFKLGYASKCISPQTQNCSPLDVSVGYLPRFMSMDAIQCSEFGSKLRFLITLSNFSYLEYGYDQLSKTTLVGEGLWDGKRNQLFIVACRILNPADSLGNAHVGDCSTRLSLWLPALWSIRNSSRAQGQMWTNKSATEVGYFDMIKLRSSDDYSLRVPGVKYEYTETNKVRRLCPKKPAKNGVTYPNAHSYDMRLDMSIGTPRGYFGWGYAEPIFVGNETYEHYDGMVSSTRWGEFQEIGEPEDYLRNAPSNVTSNVTYKLVLSSNYVDKLGFDSSLNLSSNSNGATEISAEGVYDAGTGSLCMVGCRDLNSYAQISANDSMDCEILVNLQFPGSNGENGGFAKGSIESLRKRIDPLFFEPLNLTSSAYSIAEAKQSIWRMDLEIMMVLISNTLACVFVFFQLYHVKKYSNRLPFISLIMLMILTLGHMIPLVLNFEALFLESRNRQNILLGSSGWLEVNEVIVRVVTMVAFLLELRLLQLTWTARLGDSNVKDIWSAEKKALFVTLPLYIMGGLIALLVNWKKNNYRNELSLSSPEISYYQQQPQHSLWGDLRSYAGLILDGFLFPQILLNIFQMSRESALTPPFYLGTTSIRLVPHAYDLYRGHNYVPAHVNGTYIYANPSADFYSVAWDVIIPCAGLVFAGIICLQQKYGGRFILPSRYRELELYSKVPVVST